MPSDRSRPLLTRRRARVAAPAAALLGALAIAAPAVADPVDTPSFPGGTYAGAFPDILGGATQYKPAQFSAPPPNLTVTSTQGAFGYATAQDNALMLGGPARSAPYFVQATVTPSAPGLTAAFQEAGIFVGTNLDNFVKIVAQSGGSAGTRIEMYRAPDPLASGKRVSVDLSGTPAITLTLVGNPAAGVVVGKYQLPGQSTQILGYFPYAGLGGTAGGGIITSNSGGVNPTTGAFLPPAPPLTATYTGFTVGADTTREILTPPSVASTTPGAGSTSLPTTTNVVVNFAKLMDRATLNTNTFVLRAPGGAVVPTQPIEYDVAPGNRSFVTLRPSAALQSGTTYTASLQGDIRDRLGNPLAPLSWTFTTAARGETPGEIAPSTPGRGGPGAAANALTAKFKYTARVKRGKKAKVTLTFSRKPNTTVTIQKKSGKRYLKVLSKKVKTKVVAISFPVGRKVGKFTFRAAYKDGKLTRATKTFTVRVVR